MSSTGASHQPTPTTDINMSELNMSDILKRKFPAEKEGSIKKQKLDKSLTSTPPSTPAPAKPPKAKTHLIRLKTKTKTKTKPKYKSTPRPKGSNPHARPQMGGLLWPGDIRRLHGRHWLIS